MEELPKRISPLAVRLLCFVWYQIFHHITKRKIFITLLHFRSSRQEDVADLLEQKAVHWVTAQPHCIV
jgi:hypothetical protein